MAILDEGLVDKVVEGNRVVEIEVVVPIDEFGVVVDVEVAEVVDFRVKLYFGFSSFSAASRKLRLRSATSSRSSCTSRSRLLSR